MLSVIFCVLLSMFLFVALVDVTRENGGLGLGVLKVLGRYEANVEGAQEIFFVQSRWRCRLVFLKGWL